MRGDRTWTTMFKNRDGIEPVGEGHDAPKWPVRNHTLRGTLVRLWEFVCLFQVRLNSFLLASPVKKCLSSLFPLGSWGQFHSANTCWAPALGRFCARCTKTSNTWFLLSGAESLWVVRWDSFLRYSSKFARTGLTVPCRFRDQFAEILQIQWSYSLRELWLS